MFVMIYLYVLLFIYLFVYVILIYRYIIDIRIKKRMSVEKIIKSYNL